VRARGRAHNGIPDATNGVNRRNDATDCSRRRTGLDTLRHSGPDWSYADRNRSFWLIFMFFFGPIFVVPYLFLVRPRFPGAAEQPDQAFRKP
jgi:hypothetical protein